MKYYLLTQSNKLASQLRSYDKECAEVKEAWDKLGKKYDCTIASRCGVPQGFINSNDECDAIFSDLLGYEKPIQGSDTWYEIANLPSMPMNIHSIIGIKDHFGDELDMYIAIDGNLTETDSCYEISEEGYYDLKSIITGIKTNKAIECRRCGNKMNTIHDEVCYKCGEVL